MSLRSSVVVQGKTISARRADGVHHGSWIIMVSGRCQARSNLLRSCTLWKGLPPHQYTRLQVALADYRLLNAALVIDGAEQALKQWRGMRDDSGQTPILHVSLIHAPMGAGMHARRRG